MQKWKRRKANLVAAKEDNETNLGNKTIIAINPAQNH